VAREEVLEPFVVVGRLVFHGLNAMRARGAKQVKCAIGSSQNCPAFDSASGTRLGV
jgi:hypothetical protein